MGSDRRIYELARRNTKKHQINFILVPSFHELTGALKERITKENENKPYINNGIVVYPLEIPKSVKKLARRSLEATYMLTVILLIFKALKTLITVKPKIIILNYPSVYTGLLGFFSAKVLRKICVVDFNDLIAQYTILLLNIKRESPIAKIILFVQNFIVKNSDMVITATNFLRKYALSIGVKDNKITVIPNGADTQIFNVNLSSNVRSQFNLQNKKVCVYFGRLDGWAGVHILRRICTVFAQKRTDVKFLVVGGGLEKTEFPSNVIVIEEVPFFEVPNFIASADVVLVPFPKNEVSHAAGPIKLFEGMAMGKAVIASKVCGIQEVIQDGFNGFLVESNNSEDWYKAIETVLNSKQLQIRLGKNAIETIKKYNWNVLAAMFENVLSRLIERKN